MNTFATFGVQMRKMPGLNKGFTMVEMVFAIIIMGIMAIGLTSFITDTAQGFASTANRNQVSAAGRIVLDRISMELHNTLPNSARIFPKNLSSQTIPGRLPGDQCLEFVPILLATTYINPAIRPAPQITSFDVVNLVPAPAFTGSPPSWSGVYAVIYPNSPLDIYRGTPVAPTTEAIVPVSITDTDSNDGKMEVISALHRFKHSSPAHRVFITDQPVSFCVVGNKLYRYSHYGFKTTQLYPSSPAGVCVGASECLPSTTPNRVLLSDQLDQSTLLGGSASQAFDQLAVARHRNAVVQLDLNFVKNKETVRLNHEVLVQATP